MLPGLLLAQYFEHLGKGQFRPLFKVRRGEPPYGVRDHSEGIVWYPLYLGDGLGLIDELVGDYYRRRYALLLQLDSVVQTALTAGASVPYRDDCEIALFRQLAHRLRRRGPGGVGLAGGPDLFKLELLIQHVGHQL